MNEIEFEKRCRLADELRIVFSGPVQPNRWPKTHERLFADVQQLGKRTYQSFIESITIDSIEKPWRRTTQRRAERLSQIAEKCWRERRNERGWRFRVETEVMHRFTVEVACSQCRNKLWESEIPAATDSIDKQAESLAERRKKRKPCQCSRGWSQSSYDHGINMLFSDRAEAAIKHNPPLPVSSKPGKMKRKEEPDRVYGLQQTDNFKLLLDSTDRRDLMNMPSRVLRETIEFSPFGPEGEPLLFPFLIMEAKSTKNGDQAKAEMQTAFCIRRLLKLQHDLRISTGEETQWHTGPLVWFFSWHGENWEVSAGFVEMESSPDIQYVVVDLWNGNIRNLDGALQLLLIVDYIFDWARDIYRPSIINELNTLATGEIAATDPDVFSTAGRGVSILTNSSQEIQNIHSSFINDSHDLDYLNLIHPEGVIRNASVVESRFLALRITENDVETLLLSFPSAEEAQNWVLTVLRYLSCAWQLTARTLDALERIWTEKRRQYREGGENEEIFLVNIVIFMYATENWKPVRQLTCFAVSMSALKILLTKMGHLHRLDLNSYPTVGQHAIESLLGRILRQSIMDTLVAVVSMLCISSSFYRQNGKIPHELLVARSNRLFVGFQFDKSPHIMHMVMEIYKAHKIGRREPTDLYFRSSHLQIKQTIKYRGAEIHMWPRLPPLTLDEEGRGVLVDGLYRGENSPKRGLYIFDDFYDGDDASELVRRLSKDGLYYSTMQLGSDLRPGQYFHHLNIPKKLKGEWKFKAAPQSFAAWIYHLDQQKIQRNSGPGTRPSSPMVISSDEESNNGTINM